MSSRTNSKVKADHPQGVDGKSTIFRVGSRHKPYSQLSNDALRDPRLSWDTAGVLTFILTHPENWEFTLPWLMKQRGGIGRDRCRRIIEQLVDTGYCRRNRTRRPDGLFGAYEYVFTDELSSDLKPVTGEPAPDNPSLKTKKGSDKEGHKDRREGARSFKSNLDEVQTSAPAVLPRFVSERVLDRVRHIAPGWDRQWLLVKFLEWPGSAKARNLDAAFLGWIPKFIKGRDAP